MADKEQGNRFDPCAERRLFTGRFVAASIGLATLLGGLHVTVARHTGNEFSLDTMGLSATAHGAERSSARSKAVKGLSQRIKLGAPRGSEPMACNVIQVLDSNGDPRAYYMDVASVVCTEAKCRDMPVRLHFDPLGNYERYQLPPGGNLTKLGHQPFSRADHERLHQILSDPYSQLKTIGLDEITAPKSSAAGGRGAVDAISRPTILSQQSTVVAGAAYTCCTLWHWSHGEVCDVIRDMTVRAIDQQDLLGYLQSAEEKYVVFALEQLREQSMFDAGTVAAVVQVLRYGSEKLTDPAMKYLAAASSETGDDSFFACSKDELLAANPRKRVQFLEALRDSNQDLPAGYLGQFSGWLDRAASYYEVHLLLSLLEREKTPPEGAVRGALSLLENRDSLIVRRSYKYLKSQNLDDSQQKELEAFEQRNPDP